MLFCHDYHREQTRKSSFYPHIILSYHLLQDFLWFNEKVLWSMFIVAKLWWNCIDSHLSKHPITSFSISCVFYCLLSVSKCIAKRLRAIENILEKSSCFWVVLSESRIWTRRIIVEWRDEERTPGMEVYGHPNQGIVFNKTLHCISLRLWESRWTSVIFLAWCTRWTSTIMSKHVAVVSV